MLTCQSFGEHIQGADSASEGKIHQHAAIKVDEALTEDTEESAPRDELADGSSKSAQAPTEAMDTLHMDERAPTTCTDEASSQTSPETIDREMAVGKPSIDALSEDAPKASTKPDGSVIRLIEKANGSAGKLVNLLAMHFPSFRDETRFDGRKVRLMKRAQIFVADLWAAMNGQGYGAFDDIDHLTMFAGETARCTVNPNVISKLMQRRQTTACRKCCIRSVFWCTAPR